MGQAAGSLLGLFLISIPFIRNVSYDLFLKLHVGLAFLMLYSLWRHIGLQSYTLRIALSSALGLFAVCAFMRGVRIVFRNFTWKKQWARATVFPGKDVMEIQIKVPRPWVVKPGQYLYLWAPKVSNLSIFQSHPFSIAWWADNVDGRTVTISLLVEPHHGITNSLRHKSNLNHSFRVAVDGPYGRAVDTSSYSTLVLFATGIGIAAMMPLLKGAITQSKAAITVLRRISVVWQLEDECE
jgi:predicted ferric reductase